MPDKNPPLSLNNHWSPATRTAGYAADVNLSGLYSLCVIGAGASYERGTIYPGLKPGWPMLSRYRKFEKRTIFYCTG